MSQLLLIPDDRPLVDRLGADFFRQAPTEPGVYLMRDREGRVLYVGKARNLRQRLAAYRVANPDRLARRHLRLLRNVDRIDFELCDSEDEALARESALLKTLQPRFNRAGVFSAPLKVLSVGADEEGLHLAVSAQPRAEYGLHFACGVGGFHLRQSLLRLVAFRLQPAGFLRLPAGWFKVRRTEVISLKGCPEPVFLDLAALLKGERLPFESWVKDGLDSLSSPFAVALVQQDLENLSEMLKKPLRQVNPNPPFTPVLS